MEGVALRKKAARDALKTFKESLDLMETPEAALFYRTFRDSVIQRFEYSFDTFWKYCSAFLTDIKKVNFAKIGSPRSVMTILHQENLIIPLELSALLRILESRNQTTHIYRESVAETVYQVASEAYNLMDEVIKRLEEDVPH